MSEDKNLIDENAPDPDKLTPEERTALHSRWFDISLDIDRLLLTLSLACFGVLGTVLAGNVLKTPQHFVLWMIACLAFLIEIVIVLSVVVLNKRLLTKILLLNKHQNSKLLDKMDWLSLRFFVVAVCCTAVFLGYVALSQFENIKEKEVNEQQSKKCERTSAKNYCEGWLIRGHAPYASIATSQDTASPASRPDPNEEVLTEEKLR